MFVPGIHLKPAPLDRVRADAVAAGAKQDHDGENLKARGSWYICLLGARKRSREQIVILKGGSASPSGEAEPARVKG